MNAKQKAFMAAMRKKEQAHVKRSQKAVSAPEHITPLGSFSEDDPETHKRMASDPNAPKSI